MKIMVINCGSSSLKYQLMDMATKSVITKGIVERIGLSGSILTHCPSDKEKIVIEAEVPDHNAAIQIMLKAILDPKHGVIKSLSEIDAIGHRVLHGGEKVSGSVLITQEVKDAIEECIELGPLHNPANLAGIIACEKAMPATPQVGVFDTAFHQTMPPEAYIYGIPYELYEKYHIRRYGFHGTSHRYVSQRTAAFLNKKPEELKLISCHLGNGSSLAAVNGGKCVDTSMGLTPLEGLMMGTRSGDLDPTIVSFLMEKEGLSTQEVNNFLNKKCGVLGLSGISSDFRDLLQAAENGNYRAKLAIDVFVHVIQKYIGAYAAVLNGVDAIIMTAGIGENSAEIRKRICSKLNYLGVEFDEERNNQVYGVEAEISKPGSACKVLVIPTNEELMIASDTEEIIKKLQMANQ